MFKVLGNKTPEFIEENYDYTLKLLEKTEEERLEGFKKEAAESKQIVDRPTKTQVIAEQKEATPAEKESEASEQPTGGLLNNYMDELRRS